MKNYIEMLTAFVNQRSGIEFANYGDASAFRKEQREIANDKKDYMELLRVALMRMTHSELSAKIGAYVDQSHDRLTLVGDNLQYTTGQYFPTEYRPAACRVLRAVIWNDFMYETGANGPIYPDGNAIRKAIRRNVSRRVARNYFN